MLDFSDMPQDTELGAREFLRHRPTVSIDDGGEATHVYAQSVLVGLVLPAQMNDARLLPEGTALNDVMAFFTPAVHDITSGDEVNTVADVLEVRPTDANGKLLRDGDGALFGPEGTKYKALKVQDFSQFGLYKVLAQRYSGGTPSGGP